jgi:YihY family inner membrane protein
MSPVRHFRPTFHYWMQVEAHVYGFSIAANVLLSFFPFLIVMVSLCRLLGWISAENAVYFTLNDYFPGQIGDFIQRNLKVAVSRQGSLKVISLFLLLFTANGIFEPMEVAFNRLWGAEKNRSFVRNQIVSLGLIFACGTLALLSVVLTGLNRNFLSAYLGPGAALTGWLSLALLKSASLPIAMFTLFLIYWLLPNCKIPPSRVAPAAILVGLCLEILKQVNLALWPWFRIKLEREYGPFLYSATIVLWSFLASMVILAGAELAARRGRADPAHERIIVA